jgi:hypothetical protein
MLSVMLVAASFLAATEVSVKCARTEKVETETVRGPIGTSAVLKVATHDDYSKDSHLCEADYQLVITKGPHGKSKVVASMSAECTSRFAVLGTTVSGAIVLELDSPSQCKPNGRWEVASSGGEPKRLRENAPFLVLYGNEVNTH